IDKKTAGEAYDKQVSDLKKFAKLLADPKPGLTSKVAQERLETAAMLLAKYRTPRPGAAAKTEPIDADESKQILQILADADWKAANPGSDYRVLPPRLFQSLGLTEKDGWTQPKNFNEYAPAAQKWLKDNAATYRIQKFVHDKKDR